MERKCLLPAGTMNCLGRPADYRSGKVTGSPERSYHWPGSENRPKHIDRHQATRNRSGLRRARRSC